MKPTVASPRVLALPALASVAAIVVACGGSSNAPSSSPASPAEAPDGGAVAAPDVGGGSGLAATPTSDAGASDAAASTSSDAGASNASDAGAGAGPKADPSIIADGDDGCAPVAVDFEKRARPKLKECYATGKKKDPNLTGTVKLKITVDLKGKIKSTKVVDKTLPDPVAECMVKVLKSTPFPEVEKCWDRSITIPMTFPTPK